MAATITVHAPDGEGRVFVDVVGKINDEDFKTFKEKTDQIYPIRPGHLIVTLMSYGGSIGAAVQIGDWIDKRGMSTFVPGDRTCTSACALIWLAGWPRTVGNTPLIGFHAAYDPTSRRETGAGNAVVGAYLRNLRLDYEAIILMTRKGPTSVEWLTPDLAKELGIAMARLQPPRAIPIPPQPELQARLHWAPPLQVIAAWAEWSKSARSLAPQQLPTATAPPSRPVTTSREPAQKVVLYEEDPAPNGNRFIGSVIWRTDTMTPVPGQPPELTIRADIEVPERKLAVTWSLRRNPDKGLSATHTVEIMFKLPADFPAGGISNVPGLLMKQGEQTRGVPLAGLVVKVTPAFYQIGLSNIDADKERNLHLLKELGWFTIPVVYNNKHRAILVMEKGMPGERAFADAFKAWDQYAQDPLK